MTVSTALLKKLRNSFGATFADQVRDVIDFVESVTASAAELNIMDGVTSTATELNVLDGATATPAELNVTSSLPTSASTLTVAAASGVTQAVTIQLKDADGNNLTGVHLIEVYMCTDANGATASGSGVATSVTATTGAVLKADTAKLHLRVLTDTSAKAVLSFDNTGGGGAYTDRVVLMLPTGVKVSSALAVPNA